MDEPEMIDCDCAGTEPGFVSVPILRGAPTGYICRACGQPVQVDDAGLSLPHKTPDILGWLRRTPQ